MIVVGIFMGLKMYSQDSRYGFFRFHRYTEIYSSFGSFFFEQMVYPFYDNAIFVYVIDAGILSVFTSLFFFWKMSRCALTVTNRRVTGKTKFGKAVDLPLNQISAVGLGAFSKITVATSSGRVHFWLVQNINEVHSALTDVIGKVQVEAAYMQNNTPGASNADEIKKYKDLLDSGIITQEEFDAKKKQLLGL